ncbi:hypothetical protein FP2506_15999 [Fulvimarina pelagi HTCC2506]|uniref:Uncharacterized protein n=1 Tax=Fulvimarina pelagi HTCC2506 TaxID=314231 RepID=Q0G380_9HYPH|nr:hypothetical protein FP2506_15999 [Fulvimarina pelagi HTCC2506]
MLVERWFTMTVFKLAVMAIGFALPISQSADDFNFMRERSYSTLVDKR